jgi:hypothetical protein
MKKNILLGLLIHGLIVVGPLILLINYHQLLKKHLHLKQTQEVVEIEIIEVVHVLVVHVLAVITVVETVILVVIVAAETVMVVIVAVVSVDKQHSSQLSIFPILSSLQYLIQTSGYIASTIPSFDPSSYFFTSALFIFA